MKNNSPLSSTCRSKIPFAVACLLFSFMFAVQAQTDSQILKQRLFDYHANHFSSSAWRDEPTETETGQFLSTQQSNGSWTGISYSDVSQAGGWPPREHIMRLESMAMAYRRSSSTYYQSTAMKTAVLNGLDYWFTANPVCNDNWWHMAIGRNLSLKSIAVLMEADLSTAQKDNIHDQLYYFIKATGGVYDYYCPDLNTVATGQNRLWLADIHLHGALLLNSSSEVSSAVSAIRALTAIVSGGSNEGINPDFSFMQHGAQLQSGAYGSFFAEDMARNIRMFKGLSYAFSSSETANVRGYFLEGLQWMIRRDNWDTHVIGRQLSKISETKLHPLLVNALSDMIDGDSAFASSYQAMLDHINGANDASLIGNKHFYRADYTAHRRAGYSFHTRMSSVRTMITETGNNENIQNSYLAQGTNSLLLNGDEYLNVFPCWRWNSIPGGTAPEKNPAPKTANWGVWGTKNFVGGVSNGTYGASAKDLSWDGVTGKKSWFYFDDDVVCLGAGIAYAGTPKVFTTLNQSVRKSSVYVEYGSGSGTVASDTTGTTLTNPKWVHEGNIGYVFPTNANVRLKNQTNLTGNWYSINHNNYTNPTNETKNLFTLQVDHGNTPAAATYAYILLPARDLGFTQSYSAAPQSRILSNSTSLQAVRNDVKQVASMIFWAAGQAVLTPELTVLVNKPCMVLVDESEADIKVSVSSYQADTVNLVLDFTSSQDVPMTFNLPGGSSAGMSVTQTHTPSGGGGNNLAQGKPVSFSSQQEGNEAYKAADGIEDDDNNRWSAETYPQWIAVDLGSNQTFTGTEVHGYQNRAYKFRIETKPDGGSYTTLVDETANTDPTPLGHSFAPVSARHVRLTVTGAHNYTGGWVSIREFKILGAGSPPPAGSEIVNDPFSDGSVTGTAGSGDARDINWTSLSATAQVGYTSQFAPSGNTTGALAFDSTGTWAAAKGSGAAFASTHALTVGESIALRFDFRVTSSSIPSNSSGLRFGLGSSAATYAFAMGTGSSTGKAINVYPADAIAGTPTALTTSGTALAINNTNAHTYEIVLTRTGTSSLQVDVLIDGSNGFSAAHSGVSNFTFDRVLMGEPGISNLDFNVDNVKVEIGEVVPEEDVLVSDPFSDGGVTGVAGSGDAKDIGWASLNGTAQVGYTSQFAPSGNTTGALAFDSTGTWAAAKGSGGAFASTHALAVDESATLRFDFRVTSSSIPSNSSGLRFGLGSSAATYAFVMGTGSSTDKAINVYPADAIAGTPTALTTSGTALAINNTNAHTYEMILTRTGTSSLQVDVLIDGSNGFSAAHSGVSNFTFDRVLMGEPGISNLDFNMDNVEVFFAQ